MAAFAQLGSQRPKMFTDGHDFIGKYFRLAHKTIFFYRIFRGEKCLLRWGRSLRVCSLSRESSASFH